jgi:hypothetical protein
MKPFGRQLGPEASNGGLVESGPAPVVTIIDDETRRLVFYRESKVIHHTIKAPIYGDEFRELLTRGADGFEKNGATKWLSDDRANGAIAPEDNAWADSVWVPRVMRAGFRHWAIVVPQRAIGSLQMRRLSNEFRDRGVDVRLFGAPEHAMAWLESVK